MRDCDFSSIIINLLFFKEKKNLVFPTNIISVSKKIYYLLFL